MNQSVLFPDPSPPQPDTPETTRPPPRKRWSCEQCATEETPARRRGPHGLVTLCNACGLRLKKKTKVIAAAGEAAAKAAGLKILPSPGTVAKKKKHPRKNKGKPKPNQKPKRKPNHQPSNTASAPIPDASSNDKSAQKPLSHLTHQLTCGDTLDIPAVVVVHPAALVSSHAPLIDNFSTDILEGELVATHDPLDHHLESQCEIDQSHSLDNSLSHTESLLSLDPLPDFDCDSPISDYSVGSPIADKHDVVHISSVQQHTGSSLNNSEKHHAGGYVENGVVGGGNAGWHHQWEMLQMRYQQNELDRTMVNKKDAAIRQELSVLRKEMGKLGIPEDNGSMI